MKYLYHIVILFLFDSELKKNTLNNWLYGRISIQSDTSIFEFPESMITVENDEVETLILSGWH